MNYSIYISTFGKKVLRVNGGIPIEVGAANRNNFIYRQHDDVGVNISSENEYYGELTGLYWVYKNIRLNDDEIVGFCHYNKSLMVAKRKVCKWLHDNPFGIITAKPCKIRNHPKHDEVKAIIDLLKENGKSQYEAWNKLYDDEAAAKAEICRGGNMFITSGAVFKDYCTWLFDILGRMRIIIGNKPDVDANMRRYCAYMGERLLSIYIEYKNIPTLDVKIKYKKWWLSYIRPIINKFDINKNSTIYIVLKDLFGYNSQYNRK